MSAVKELNGKGEEERGSESINLGEVENGWIKMATELMA
jgi:hypothetical protein